MRFNLASCSHFSLFSIKISNFFARAKKLFNKAQFFDIATPNLCSKAIFLDIKVQSFDVLIPNFGIKAQKLHTVMPKFGIRELFLRIALYSNNYGLRAGFLRAFWAS